MLKFLLLLLVPVGAVAADNSRQVDAAVSASRQADFAKQTATDLQKAEDRQAVLLHSNEAAMQARQAARAVPK